MESMRNIKFSPPDITNLEIQAVTEVLRSGWITTGPQTKEFERQIASYVGVSKAVCLNSGTAGLELTLRLLGIGPGDEVITTPYTYSATAAVISHLGASIRFVDIAPDSYEMDYNQLAQAINANTKAIIPVDIGGKICDYKAIYDAILLKKELFTAQSDLQSVFNRVIVVADAAHAFGAEQAGFNCGQIADFTCFSFHAVKNLTTAEGGAVVWKDHTGLNNEELYNAYMLYALHGQSKDALAKTARGAWEYDIVYPAYKYNMTDISAALGIAQLVRYRDLSARRREIVEQYESRLKLVNIMTLQHYGEGFSSSGHLLLTRIPGIEVIQRNEIITAMGERGIPCNVHYKPLPMFTAYQNLGYKIEDFPNAFSMYKNEITLPLHTLLSNDDVDYVCSSLQDVINQFGWARW